MGNIFCADGKWSTLGSKSDPHLAHIFEGTCGPLIDPTLLFQKCFFEPFFGPQNLLLAVSGDFLLFFVVSFGVKCGPLIDPTKGKMWTTY